MFFKMIMILLAQTFGFLIGLFGLKLYDGVRCEDVGESDS